METKKSQIKMNITRLQNEIMQNESSRNGRMYNGMEINLFFFFFLLNPVHHDVYFIISIFELIDMYTKYFKQKNKITETTKQ